MQELQMVALDLQKLVVIMRAQFYPTQLAIEKGYNQVIWTDDTSHEYIEEAGAMNIFVE